MAPIQRKHRQNNDTIQESSMLHPRITTEKDPLTTQVESSIRGRGNTNFVTARTQVGRRISNGNIQKEQAPDVTHFNLRSQSIQVSRRDYNGNIQKGRAPGETLFNRRNESIRSTTESETQPPSFIQDNVMENLLGEDHRVQNQLMSGRFEEEEEHEGIDNEGDDEEKITRGPTYMQHIWGRPLSLPRIHVVYNAFGQPIDGEHSTLCHFLGTIARNPKYCPVDVKNWHGMSNLQRSEMLNVVKLRFHVPVIAEKWILASIGCKWRNWKHYLKTRYWVKNVAIEDLIDERDPRVLPDQWIKLLTYWSTEEAQKASDNNKKARDKKKMDQRTGKTSFAQIKERLRKEKGRSPTRVELFGSCFVSPNGNSSNETSSAYAAMQERSNQLGDGSEDVIAPYDIFAQIMGKDKPGQVRMLGKGVCPSDIWSGTPRSTSNTLIMNQQAEIARLRSMLLTQQQPLTSQVSTRQDALNSYSVSPHTMTTLSLQVGTYVSLQSMFTKKVVAKGCIHSIDPGKKVGGQMLGENWCEIIVKVILEPDEELLRPYDNFQKLYQTLDEMIAWPISLVTQVTPAGR